MGQTYLAEPDAGGEDARTLRPLQAAAVTYRIAFGPRAGQKVLTLRGATPREATARQPLCADIDGFSLHAAVRVEAHDRKRLEQLCRYITRPALSDERVQLNAAGQVELKLKTQWRDGTGFDIDMQHCPNCGAGELKIIAAILERPVIETGERSKPRRLDSSGSPQDQIRLPQPAVDPARSQCWARPTAFEIPVPYPRLAFTRGGWETDSTSRSTSDRERVRPISGGAAR
jgi:hypothetical protein